MSHVPYRRQPDKVDRVVGRILATLFVVGFLLYAGFIGYMAYRETPAPPWWGPFKERLWR